MLAASACRSRRDFDNFRIAEQADLSGAGGGDLLRRCAACGKAAAPKKCAGCKSVRYCGPGAGLVAWLCLCCL